MDIFTILIIILLSVLFYHLYSNKFPPGPTPLPLIGHRMLIRKLCKQHGGFHKAVSAMCKMYKSDIVFFTLANSYTCVIQSDELLDQVFNRDEFQGRPDSFFLRLRTMGKRAGITMTDGPFWTEQRTFAMRHLRELGFGKRRMETIIQEQLKGVLSKLNGNNCITSSKLRVMMSKGILNVLWVIITGEPFKEKTLNDLISLMENRAKVFDMSGGILNYFPWLRYIFPKYSGYELITNLNKEFYNMITDTINTHKKSYSSDTTRSFIDAFLHEVHQNNSPNKTFTEEQLVFVCLDFFIAGSQTTSSTLDFLFLNIVKHQDIQDKVQKSLDSILKPGELPFYNDRTRCPYVEAVILESQRLTTAVPITGPRRVTQDTTLGGYFVPKDTTIFMNAVPSNMNPSKWEDPEVMKPERFLNENDGSVSDHKLYTFAKGKRRCPGDALAKNFLFLIFAGIVHNYKLTMVDSEKYSNKIIPGITLTPDEYSIKFTKRF